MTQIISANYSSSIFFFMVSPCINDIQHSIVQLMHTTLKNVELLKHVVCFLLGNSLASEFYMPTFRNTLFHLHRQVVRVVCTHLPACEDGTDRVF